MTTNQLWFLPAVCVLSIVAVPVARAREVKVAGSAEKVAVSVVRRVELSYYFVVRDQALEFEAEGPTWLRVYTRLWWPEGQDGKLEYSLSLWQNEVERPLEFETELSKSSYGAGTHKLGKWRSFYIQVPKGRNPYRLVLNDAPAGTVAVRFSFQNPKSWNPVVLSGLDELLLAESEDTVSFYCLERGSPAALGISGPCRVRVRIRLNYEPSMVGAQNFVLTVREQGKELAGRNFRVTKSGSVIYQNALGVVPSTERTLRFNLGQGALQLTIALNGTLAHSAGIRVERIAREKYE